jgi:hypothetical protein
LLPLHVLQAKSKAIKMRHLKKQISFVRHNDSFVDGAALIPQQDEIGEFTQCSSGFQDILIF